MFVSTIWSKEKVIHVLDLVGIWRRQCSKVLLCWSLLCSIKHFFILFKMKSHSFFVSMWFSFEIFVFTHFPPFNNHKFSYKSHECLFLGLSYVNDILVTGSSKNAIQSLITTINQASLLFFGSWRNLVFSCYSSAYSNIFKFCFFYYYISFLVIKSYFHVFGQYSVIGYLWLFNSLFD